MAGLSVDTFDGGWDDSFATGLELLLDGLESHIATTASGSKVSEAKPRLFGAEDS